MRDELLNETLFFDLDDARAKIAAWDSFNTARPHSALGYLTRRPTPPTSPQRTISCAPDQLRRSHVAPTGHKA